MNKRVFSKKYGSNWKTYVYTVENKYRIELSISMSDNGTI